MTFILLLPPIILTPYLIPTPVVTITETGFVDTTFLPGYYFSTTEWSQSPRLYIVNDTPIVEKDWYIGSSHGADNSTLHRTIDVILSNFTQLVCEATVYVKNDPCEVLLQISNDLQDFDILEAGEETTLSIDIPVTNYFHYEWTYYIGLYTDSSFFSNVEVRGFRMWAQSAVSLFPVRINLARTNGEDIQRNPTDWDIRPRIDFREFNNSDFNHEYRIWSSSEVIYIRPGNYSGSFRWEDSVPFNLTVEDSKFTNWTIVLDVARIEFEFSTDVISYALRTEGFIPRISPFDNTIMYHPLSEIGFTITSGGSHIDVPYEDFGYQFTRCVLNSTSNVLVSVNLHFIQIGPLASTERGLLLLILSIVFVIIPAFFRVLKPLYSKRRSLIKDGRFISLVLYTLSLVSPWIHASLPEWNQPSLVYMADFRGLAFRMWWTKDSSVLLIHSRFLITSVGIVALSWLFALSMLIRISSAPDDSHDSIFLILILSSFLVQILYMIYVLENTAWIQVLPSFGMALTGLAFLYHAFSYFRKRANQLRDS